MSRLSHGEEDLISMGCLSHVMDEVGDGFDSFKNGECGNRNCNGARVQKSKATGRDGYLNID